MLLQFVTTNIKRHVAILLGDTVHILGNVLMTLTKHREQSCKPTIILNHRVCTKMQFI